MNEAETSSSKPMYPKSIPRSMANDVEIGGTANIYDFLAKPVRIRSGNLAVTDTVSTFSDLAVLRTIGGSLVIKNKMVGYFGFRGSAVYTLQVNGNKFQQGRYILAWLPSGGPATEAGAATCWNRMHRFTLCQITQLPHVELDIACDTSVTLTIPYSTVWSSTPINTIISAETKADLGWLIMVPYSPLKTATGSTTASFTLWGHYEDVELLGATMPQSGWEPQSGRIKSSKKSFSNSEQEQKEGKIGPIGSTLSKVSLAASELAKVPFLSTMAMPVKWAADIAFNISYIFGWSSPLDLSPVTRVQQHAMPYITNVDVPSVSMPLSLMSRNEVGVLPGFSGNDIDEMSIDYLKVIPAYLHNMTWSTTDVKETALFVSDIDPSRAMTTVDDGITVTNYSPMAYISQFFEYYRGSVTYTFKFVKTSFHSGRLMFVFIPWESDGTTPAFSFDNTAYCHRSIVDIRESNEVIINLPYTSNRSYRSTRDTGKAYGYLYVYVVDPLVAPASVSSSIDILIEISGGPDLEWQKPRNITMVPVVPTAPQSGWEPQSGEGCLTMNSTVGGSQPGKVDLLHCQATMGEKIVSFRAMLKRSVPLRPVPAAISAGTGLAFAPFSWPVGFIDTATYYPPPVYPDFYGHMCSIYAMSRGGVRLKTYSAAVTSERSQIALSTRTNVTAAEFGMFTYLETIDTFEENYQHGLRAVVKQDLSGMIDIQVPQYHMYHSRTNCDNFLINASHPGLKLVFDKTTTDRNVIHMLIGASTLPLIYRSGADDANFGLFTSIPPMYLPP